MRPNNPVTVTTKTSVAVKIKIAPRITYRIPRTGSRIASQDGFPDEFMSSSRKLIFFILLVSARCVPKLRGPRESDDQMNSLIISGTV